MGFHVYKLITDISFQFGKMLLPEEK